MDKFLPLKQIVEKYNLAAKKSLGQNFLFDQNLTDKIVRASGNVTGKNILEIGPGPGGLTRSILACNISKLVAIEPDIRCIEALKELQNHYGDKFEIVNGDALKIAVKDIFPTGMKIIANLPYNIATVLFFQWLNDIEYFESLTLMFQKEVAMRIIAKPSTKAYGRVSVMAQAFADIEHAFDIPPSAFVPRPKITSSVINIIPHNKNPHIDKSKLSNLCKIAFNHRRKLLKSALSSFIPNILEIYEQLDIHPNARAEELTIEQFCKLSKFL
ncbi:MAG: 16S rRNA (adenine(1518)-N(6)/adenine(1519)-N(6))-dimethyltransferase RsmA [Alphaproteobacteria bacterium]